MPATTGPCLNCQAIFTSPVAINPASAPIASVAPRIATSPAPSATAEPLRDHAFFKRTPEGLKLDWEISAKAKYRTFRSFIAYPKPGQAPIFRFVAMEDVPETGRSVTGTRSYRLLNPATPADSVRINVAIDSIGRALAELDWLGTKDAVSRSRTVTDESKWSGGENSPLLEISRFVCWILVGSGGEDVSAIPATQ